MLARALTDLAHPTARGPGRLRRCLPLVFAFGAFGTFGALGCADRAPPADWPEPPPPVLAKPIEGPSASGTAGAEPDVEEAGPGAAQDAAVNKPEDGAAAIDAGTPDAKATPEAAAEEGTAQPDGPDLDSSPTKKDAHV